MVWPVMAAPARAVTSGASAVTAFRKRSKGSGRFVTVGSPRTVRVGRQDHWAPIRPQRTLPLRRLRARQPFPGFGAPATHRIWEECAGATVGNRESKGGRGYFLREL